MSPGLFVSAHVPEGTTNVYDPTFATEAEAEAKAAEVASGIRDAYAVEGPRP